MLREREEKTLEVYSQNPFGNDGGALLLNGFRFTFESVFLMIFDTFFMKNGPRRAPGPSKRLKKQQKLS